MCDIVAKTHGTVTSDAKIATNASHVGIETFQRLPVAAVNVNANVYVAIGDRQSAVDNPRCGIPCS